MLMDAGWPERLVVDGRGSIVIRRDRGDADLPVVDQHRRNSLTHCRTFINAGAAWIEHLSRTNTTRLDDPKWLAESPSPWSMLG
ncbi:MAG: hypothetical protein ACOYN0_07640 [Phycisphaerales bacterium]